MSKYTIHLRSYSPDLLIEFDLPPGTHACIGASPKAEITLPLTGIPPFSCTIGRFQNGRMFLANLDGSISRRVDLPDTLPLPPYQFSVLDASESALAATQSGAPGGGEKPGSLNILPLAIGAVGVVGVAAAIAVSQCGKPAAHDRPGPAAPTRTVPKAEPGKAAPAPAVPNVPVPPADVKKTPAPTR